MAKTKFAKVYQFKITLKGTKPPVWRRIQVPENYTFWDLHVAIQDAMGWEDGHLHEFEMRKGPGWAVRSMGMPDDDSPSVLPEWKQKIADWFSKEKPKALYTYDFGDDWQHEVKLEKVLPTEENVKYPRCVTGKRACPPEDCGGIWGYEEILAGASEFQEEYDEYDPEHFDCAEVYFTDAAKRLKLTLKMRS